MAWQNILRRHSSFSICLPSNLKVPSITASYLTFSAFSAAPYAAAERERAELLAEVEVEMGKVAAARREADGRGLHSSTFQLNVSTFCGIEGVRGLFRGGIQGVFRACLGFSVCLLRIQGIF